MGVNVRIPGPLRRVTNGEPQVEIEAANVQQTIDLLDSRFPGIKERLCDESGDLRYFVNVYLNGEDVRFLQGLQTATKTGDELSIVPAVAGGGNRGTTMGKYDSLKAYFLSRPGTQRRIQLDFDQVGHIVGALPNSAFQYNAWWANDLTHVHAQAWLSAGWKTENLNLSEQTVDFVRR